MRRNCRFGRHLKIRHTEHNRYDNTTQKFIDIFDWWSQPNKSGLRTLLDPHDTVDEEIKHTTYKINTFNMNSESLSTSLYSVLSCEHGRMRREQRDISKRDLSAALKYGTKKKAFDQRWKLEHDGLVFIVNENLTQEVTAYPAPLEMAVLTDHDYEQHEKCKTLIEMKPILCVSHTVLIVDNSGSMTTHDIVMHRDRQTAAYTELALELVAEQLFTGTSNNSDLVSLVEFRDKATIVFEREPISWVLYNKLLERRSNASYRMRLYAEREDIINCNSNYLPALDAAETILNQGIHDNCALSLFFLTDGAPTDAKNLDLTPLSAERKLCERMSHIAETFDGHQLSVAMIGFGSESTDFSILEKMVIAVNEAPGDARADFKYCAKIAHDIGTAITNSVSTTLQSKTALQEGCLTRKGKTHRCVMSEADTKILNDWKFYEIADHFTYSATRDDFVRHSGLPPGSEDASNKELVNDECREKKPPLLAINTSHCGKGVERLAFRSSLTYEESPAGFVLNTMVAKETLLVERIEENIQFHKGFLMTQSLAAFLAKEFNRRLQALPHFSRTTTPRIEFLPCSVLVLIDDTWQGGKRGMLLEKMLNTERFQWTKWNNNAGSVNGKLAHFPIDVDKEVARLEASNGVKFEAIEEGDSEDESDDDDDDDDDDNNNKNNDGKYEREERSQSDYLQAYSHFTYFYTKRQVMVCDLQGIYNTDFVPPTFELTDPAIHYSSKKGRSKVFGRTDLGRDGIKRFFKTHVCNGVCEEVNRGKRNKFWKKDWRSYSH